MNTASSWATWSRVLVAGGVTIVTVASWGCIGPWTPAPAPVPTRQLAPMPPGGECLFVFLPGRGDRVGVFGREGFAPLLAAHGIRAEAVEVDLHLGYYARRSIDSRLHQDVILPARARGVREIWLVGVSMGGLGTLIYNHHYPGQADGLVLLAPFLGNRKVVDEIAAAGGLAAWRPGVPLAPDDWQREVWTWLQEWTGPRASPPALVLGYGLADSVARSNRLLAEVLPAPRVFTVEGKHDWREWRELWTAMLVSGQVGSRCRQAQAGGRR